MSFLAGKGGLFIFEFFEGREGDLSGQRWLLYGYDRVDCFVDAELIEFGDAVEEFAANRQTNRELNYFLEPQEGNEQFAQKQGAKGSGDKWKGSLPPDTVWAS